MRYCLAALLCLAVASAQAEPYTVWEQDWEIWSRDEATGIEQKISRSDRAWSPSVDGPLAIWIANWSYPADVMGKQLTSYTAAWSIAVQPEIASDPQIAYLGLPGEWAYATWRQSGGIWAKRMRDFSPPPAEVVPNYSGPYDLTGRTLTWDGGTMELDFPTPIVPEPSALVLLLIGLLCCGWHVNSRRGRSSGS